MTRIGPADDAAWNRPRIDAAEAAAAEAAAASEAEVAASEVEVAASEAEVAASDAEVAASEAAATAATTSGSMTSSTTSGSLVEDRRLATLHLRLGGLSLARAELEDLRRRGALDSRSLAELAEVRWRSGDLKAAAEAAAEHLAAGGKHAISRVIAAEAAAAVGNPAEARVHVEALGAVNADVLDRVFAGMPRRALWPSAPNPPIDLEALGKDEAVPRSASGPLGGPDELGERQAPAGRVASGGRQPATPGFWDDDGTRERTVAPTDHRPAEPAEEMARAREELRSGDPDLAVRGLARLSLVLRQDPRLAPAVLEAIGQRGEPGALLLRGDAYRLVGRRLEAEAAFEAAARALDQA